MDPYLLLKFLYFIIQLNLLNKIWLILTKLPKFEFCLHFYIRIRCLLFQSRKEYFIKELKFDLPTFGNYVAICVLAEYVLIAIL